MPGHVAHSNCLNCGAALHGDFCGQCGQAAHEGREPSLAHFGHELVHEFAHVDGKIFRTARALLFRPGFLTAEYWRGRVTSWVRPLRIFLIVVALNLLVVHDGVGPMNFRLAMSRDTAGNVNVVVNANPDRMRLRKDYIPVPEHERQELATRFRSAYSTVRYVSVLLFAAGMWMLFRKRQAWYVNHLIAGLHFYSAWYVMAAIGARVDLLRLPALFGAFMYLFFMLRTLFPTLKSLRRLLVTIALFAWLAVIEVALGWLAITMAQRGWIVALGH